MPVPLPFRDALHDDDGVASVLRHQGTLPAGAIVTIAIPTFNRPDLIRETLASALAQTFASPFEILVVDNASEPENVEALLAHLRSLGDIPVRYFVNDGNIGMFGNWNRCISLARTPWLTILSDDDLLLPSHLQRMFEAIDAVGDTRVSFTCGFTFLDQRKTKARSPLVTAVFLRVKTQLRFLGKSLIGLPPSRLFWGNLAGSGLGAVFSRALAMEVGGFYPEDFPSGDYYFHTRCAMVGKLYQVSDNLARMRLQVNETMKPSTLLGFIRANHRLRMGLVGSGQVPQRWATYSPMLIAYERRASLRFTGVDLDAADVATETGEQERRRPTMLVWLLRALKGGL